MLGKLLRIIAAFCIFGWCSNGLKGLEPSPPEPISWQTDYAAATEAAERDGKMVLIYFAPPASDARAATFDSHALADPNIVARLRSWATVRLPIDAKITIGGKPVELLAHSAFAEMLRCPGLAMLDFAHRGQPYYGQVVGTFPFSAGCPYTPCEVAAMLDLPAGTLTQRTLIYAVRVHPEHPASTEGRLDPKLLDEAECHSCYQARLRLQGHHLWDLRFPRINAKLPGGLMAREVCAESWPGQGLLASALECVRCWRTSSGHWDAVRRSQPVYAYDMKRGDNGVWYATGIFGGR